MSVERPNVLHTTAARAVAVLTIAISLSAAGIASAAPVPASPTPLPGSEFQGGDGDQNDATPYVDWQHLQAIGAAVHAPDHEGPDSAFERGTKENEPGSWTLTSEADAGIAGKADILDAWGSVDQRGGNTFLYLAFTRRAADGNTYVAFELNRDTRLWNNGRATIPCRTTGDLLVAFTAHGNSMDVVLERWTTTASDAATRCAKTGRLDAVASIPAGTAQGDVNESSITNHLPGVLPSPIAPGLFGEAALNLGQMARAAFGDDCLAFASVWMHSRSSSSSDQSQMQDYLAPQPLTVRSCTASGTKFLDRNANGRRDDGEPGLPRFLIWADYDGDGVQDATEPFAITDRHGHYVIHDIRPPSGHYTLRETVLAGRRPATATSWTCSFPTAGTSGGFGDRPGGLFGCGWGPIDAAAEPDADNRDFGNWLPARLTVEKQLWPSDDPGRFKITVNGEVLIPAAGDGARQTIEVLPGSYDILEEPVPPTAAGDYVSIARCGTTPRRRGRARTGTGWTGLVLNAGAVARCRFTNVRRGSPAIAIEKTGPVLARAGATLRYTLYVTNPGSVPIRSRTVKVRDARCDEAPTLVSKGGDSSRRTLDPGDTWTYRCSYDTPAPGDDCALSTVTNRATVVGAAAGRIVRDRDDVTTTLRCPDQPPEPPIPTPEPTPEPTPPTPTPGPTPPTPTPNPSPVPLPAVVPGGATPPLAGAAAVAGLHVPSAACVSRVSQVLLVGTHLARIRVDVDGRLAGQRTLQLLQRITRPLSHTFGPGRHRLSVHVTFERGAGTPPVTLSRTIRVCGSAPPRFTG
jgi:hypothetical protein